MAIDILVVVVVAIVAFLAGWFFGKSQAYARTDLGAQTVLLSDLKSQLTEVKTRFTEVEKRREELAKAQEKFEAEKEKRLKDFMAMTEKFFKAQDENREKTEKTRDGQISRMAGVIEAFSRTVHGTQSRGKVGEALLKEVLKSSIKTGLVVTDLRTESGVVEFAWRVGKDKFLPIDAKFPDITELLEALSTAESATDQKSLQRQIGERLKKQIEEVRKYQNQSKTIDHCVLVVPEGALEAAPEVIAQGASQNVHLCSMKEVFLVSYLLAEAYEKLQEKGDKGQLQALVKQLLSIMDSIQEKTDTVDRGLKMAQKATDEIKGKVREGKRV